MRVYLASWYASRDDMKIRAAELREAGIEVTSRWLEEVNSATSSIKDNSEDYLRDTAYIDVEDVLLADTVVLNVPSQKDLATYNISVGNWARGGRHFEAGFQYATMLFFNYLPSSMKERGKRQLILVGHKENVFHYLDGTKRVTLEGCTPPAIQICETWEEAKAYLVADSGKMSMVGVN
jgi:hypothetical protein